MIGWFLDFFWNLRYWDYSGYFLNFRGYICLVSALGFGIAGVLWVCIFSKILQKWWYHISLDFRKKWNMFGVFIFVTDCACLLYTSDAADEEDSEDLGGCSIFEKKKKTETQ